MVSDLNRKKNEREGGKWRGRQDEDNDDNNDEEEVVLVVNVEDNGEWVIYRERKKKKNEIALRSILTLRLKDEEDNWSSTLSLSLSLLSSWTSSSFLSVRRWKRKCKCKKEEDKKMMKRRWNKDENKQFLW